MNYKTIMICAVIGTSMQSAWAMDANQNANDNNKPVEISEIAQLAAAMAAAFKGLETTIVEDLREIRKDLREVRQDLKTTIVEDVREVRKDLREIRQDLNTINGGNLQLQEDLKAINAQQQKLIDAFGKKIE